MIQIDIPKKKKIYFSSDHHLGVPDLASSLIRERRFVRWLDEIKKDAQALFILGDLFDFWFEYKRVVPKGFVRVLGKLAEITDSGIAVYFFVGNHDLWMRDYFKKELQISIFFIPHTFHLGEKKFLLGHGDGLGDGDKGYKRMKRIFIHPLSEFIFRWLHPDIGMKLGHYFSAKNKLISGDENIEYLGEDKEWIVKFCKDKLEHFHYDFFIFGHRHLPLNIPLSRGARYINLGDWVTHFSYGVFDGNTMVLKIFKD